MHTWAKPDTNQGSLMTSPTSPELASPRLCPYKTLEQDSAQHSALNTTHKHVLPALPAHLQQKSSYNSMACNLTSPPHPIQIPFPKITLFRTFSQNIAQTIPSSGLLTALLTSPNSLFYTSHFHAPISLPISAYSHSFTSPELFHLDFPQTFQITDLIKSSVYSFTL